MKRIIPFFIVTLLALITLASCSKDSSEDQEVKKVTLTFNSMGGSNVPSQVLNAGAHATEPEDPTREGYYFYGWVADETAELWDFETDVVESDMTLYAIWSEEEVPSVTVMYYGVGGGNLDYKQVWKMRQAASLGADDNFNMTFQYKFSKELKDKDERYEGYNGVLRLDIADAEDMKDCRVYSMTNNNMYRNLEGLPLKQYSDDDEFDMADTDEIAKFIRWSIEKHPADKYVLIFANHGGGWEVTTDGGAQKATRGILYDDNLDNQCLTATSVTEGIRKSGANIEVLYLDACLMGAWENLFEYRKAPVKYVVSSMEVSYGGDYEKMIPQIKLQPDNLYDAFKSYIDHRIAAAERMMYGYTDMGILDMSLVDEMAPIIRNAAELLIADNKNPDEYVSSRASGVARLALTTYWPNIWVPFEMADDIFDVYGNMYSKEKKENYMLSSDIVLLYRVNHYDRWASLSEETQNLMYKRLLQRGTCGLAFGDLLKQYKDLYADAPDEYASYKAKATALYESYISALKRKSYFKANHCDDPELPYIEVSPSINLMALNEDGWVKPADDGGNINCIPLAKNYELDEVIRAYSSCELSKQTSWVEYLKVNPLNPSLFSNRTRTTRYCRK